MRTLACLVAAGLLALFASGARAQTAAYAEAFDTLYRVDLPTRTATPIGPAGSSGGQVIGNISGLTFDPDGNLFAVAGGMNALIRIDPSSGHATVVGSFGLTGQGDPSRNDALDLSMTFACDGTLWAVLNYVPPQPGSDTVPDWSDLARIDPASGTMMILGPITGPSSLSQVGMKGFAMGPPTCVTGSPAVFAAPVNSPPWLAMLGIVLALVAVRALRRRVAR